MTISRNESHATTMGPRKSLAMSRATESTRKRSWPNINRKQRFRQRLAKIIAGSYRPITKNIVLAGETQSAKTIESAMNDVTSADDTCDELHMKLEAATKVAKAARAKATVLTASLKKYVVAHFGESSPVLADFGFTPRKLAQKTVAEKFQTVEKQLATRAARHTMGSRQKSAIHGSIAPSPVPAPVVQPAPAPVVTNGVSTSSGSTQSAILSLNGSNH